MIAFAAVSLLLAAMPQDTDPSGPAQNPTPVAACSGEEFAAFDFWIGEWDVYASGADQKLADSRIERVSNGCAIRETWMPLRGGGGSSVTALDPQTGVWHQLWVGSQPGEVDFLGGPVDGAMVLTGYWGRDPEGNPNLVRMTYTLEEDGSVRQYGQASTDHGRTWNDSFDLVYRRKDA